MPAEWQETAADAVSGGGRGRQQGPGPALGALAAVWVLAAGRHYCGCWGSP